MAKNLLIQYFGTGADTTFPVPTVTSGYMPYITVNGEVVNAVYSTNLFTFSPAPAEHDIVEIWETNDIVAAVQVQTQGVSNELLGTAPVGQSVAGGANAYIRTDVGTKTLSAADASNDRMVFGVLNVTTVFANGDGAKPTLKIGETSTIEKFLTAAVVATLSANLGQYIFAGTLAATKDFVATLVAATGTTSTGAYTINWFIGPKS